MADPVSGFAVEAAAGRAALGRFAHFAALPALGHGVSTRGGPDFASAVGDPAHAIAALELAHSVGLGDAAWMRQIHGGEVILADSPGLLGAADAMVSARPGLAVVARSADCPLVFAVALDSSGAPRAAGIAHASWKGTVARVTENMLAALLRLAGTRAASAVAAIAPCAGPCCYEVGEEVRAAALAGIGAHAAGFFIEKAGCPHFDLWRANLDQLLRGGLPESGVALAGICTICEDTHFHSHRRDGAKAGRFAGAVGLLPRP